MISPIASRTTKCQSHTLGEEVVAFQQQVEDFGNDFVSEYTDRAVANPGITQPFLVKGTAYEETWNTLMKIRDKQREKRIKDVDKRREQIRKQWGDVASYLFAQTMALQYTGKLNSLCIIYPGWENAKEYINHFLLQRRINFKTGQRYGLHPGVADIQ